MNKTFLKGDWGHWRHNTKERIELGYGKEIFVGYTTRHKIRLFFGIDGQQHNGKYCFKVPKWGGKRTQRAMHNFMYRFGNPLLNFLIG